MPAFAAKSRAAAAAERLVNIEVALRKGRITQQNALERVAALRDEFSDIDIGRADFESAAATPATAAASPPEPQVQPAAPGGGPPEFPKHRAPDTYLFRSETGEQLPVDPIGLPKTFPGQQPVVQGVAEGRVQRPPFVGGEDVAGRAMERLQAGRVRERGAAEVVQGVDEQYVARRPFPVGGDDPTGRRLARDAEQRIETFEQRARETGAPEPIIKAVSQAYRDGEFFASTARRYIDSNPVTQLLAKGDAWIEGKVPDGVVNQVARAHLVAENAIRLHVDEQLQTFRQIDAILERAKPRLQFIGPESMKPLAERHMDAAIVTHPEWFAKKPAELRVALEALQKFQNDLYKIVQAIDPNAAPALDAPYLRTVWDVPESSLTSAVTMPIGRASVTKKRAFPDPFEAMASNKWPYALKETPVSELVESGAHLAARQIGTQLERKMILQRFGTTTRRPGVVQFRNPNYAGWYAPREIVNFIDQLHEPGGSVVRATGTVTNPIRNTVFGVGDFGVMGSHVLELLSTRGPIVLGGAINRSLQRIGLGMDLYRYADEDLPRAMQRAVDGLPQGSAGRISDQGAQTLFGLTPVVGKELDAAIDALNTAQFSAVLTPLRNMAYEGNLMVSKLLGQDITKASVRRRAAENASAFSGASLGALRRARREGESAFLGAPSITRALGAQLVQVARLNTPEAWTTLASIGATVYGLGSALNIMFGSGEPVPWDPRRVDWATVHLGGQWKDVEGQRRYVGGRKIRLIPQASVVRAIGKSMNAIEKGDPNAFIRAWEQVGYTRLTPGVQSPLSAIGIGFDNEGRFQSDLPFGQRVQNVLPMPILGQEAVGGEIDSPFAATLTFLGASQFPGDDEDEIAKDITAGRKADVEKQLALDAPTLERGWESNYWRDQFANAGLSVAPAKDDTFDEFRDKWVEYWIDRRPKNTSEAFARDRVVRAFDGLLVVREFKRQQSTAMERYWRADPELMKQAIDANIIDATDERSEILRKAGLLEP